MSREVNSAGTLSSTGKVGRPSKQDTRQRKLTIEGKEEGKRVTFKMIEDKGNGGSKDIDEVRESLRLEIREEIVKVKEEWKKGIKELREEIMSRLKVWEGKVVEWGNKIEETEKRLERFEHRLEEEQDVRVESREQGEVRSASGSSRLDYSFGGSEISSMRSRLSNWEVDKVRKIVMDLDKEERKRNIVIKGVKFPKEVENDKKGCNDWMKNLLKEKIGIESEELSCRLSGPVIIVKLESEEKKKDIMRNKLKGERGKVNQRRSLLFWNVAGIENKDRDFWNYIKGFDYISLCETWIDEKGWDKLKKRLSSTHVWDCSFAEKGGKRGRAKGGFIIGKRKLWGEESEKLIKEEGDGMVSVELIINKRKITVVSVYGLQGGKDLSERLEDFIGKKEYDDVIIGGDFNIRIGELGDMGEEEGEVRCSKDKVIGNGGKKFVEWIAEKGWSVLNGRTEGVWSGEFTYVGARSCSVIDYILVSENVLDKIQEFKM
ncbi:hypothetical protein ALC62_13071 [Cyphomyrmex costatus]|uniref:Endonuclease/exonuclease/phosphatase domain-containing protein n=1 Tax=Cyphomyrmex costatus TaxID=456900 RepID=A0A151IAC3_9HYME|nr:hypothetical protein ALC62_13071 [Cyphomyrmex costatus]